MFKSLPLKVSVLGALTLPPVPYYIPPLHLQTPSKLIRTHSIHCLTTHLLPNPFPSRLRLLSTPFSEVTSYVPAVKSSAHCPGLILLEVLASFRAAGHWLPFEPFSLSLPSMTQPSPCFLTSSLATSRSHLQTCIPLPSPCNHTFQPLNLLFALVYLTYAQSLNDHLCEVES